MPKTKAQPMATKHDEITLILQQAGEDDIEIIHRSDEIIIHIKFLPEQKSAEKKGKWARVAEELSREAPLTGIGEEFLKHTKQFRKNLMLKSPFPDTE
jgi:hypothetical protein